MRLLWSLAVVALCACSTPRSPDYVETSLTYLPGADGDFNGSSSSSKGPKGTTSYHGDTSADSTYAVSVTTGWHLGDWDRSEADYLLIAQLNNLRQDISRLSEPEFPSEKSESEPEKEEEKSSIPTKEIASSALTVLALIAAHYMKWTAKLPQRK